MMWSRAIQLFEQQAPAVALALRAQLDRRRGEPDLEVAIQLTANARTTVDVGANRGVYSHWLARRAQRCVAIETNPECADLLRRALGSRIEVFEVALSNATGQAELTIPVIAGRENSYRSSLEQSSDGHTQAATDLRTVAVKTATLDSFTLSEVDFIKIDVEGHEIETLDGARETIIRCRPTVLIEAEERHRAGSVAAVRTLFAELGYQGFFLFKDKVMSIDDFALDTHQVEPVALGARSASYVNNFIFVSPDRTEQLRILDSRQ